MKRIPYFAALAASIALIAGPAIADHVTEPTAPVTGLFLKVYKYTDPLNTMMRCDGTDRITFDQVRIEPGVSVAGKPSEHYTVNVNVAFAESLSGRAAVTFKQWGASWKHQNVAPHANGGTAEKPREVAEVNQWLHGRLGFWIVETSVTGEESGAAFTRSCTFERVAG